MATFIFLKTVLKKCGTLYEDSSDVNNIKITANPDIICISFSGISKPSVAIIIHKTI
jgi:hypothetical protein